MELKQKVLQVFLRSRENYDYKWFLYIVYF